MVEGWTLVVPADHIMSLAEMNSDRWLRFAELMNRARDLVENVYGDTVLFEHGSAGPGRPAGCGVDHAHLHIVPIRLDLRTAIAQLGDKFERIVWEPAGNRPSANKRTDYIYISDETGDWITHAEILPGQVVRRAIAKHIKVPLWDWRDDYHLDVSARTLDRLRRGA